MKDPLLDPDAPHDLPLPLRRIRKGNHRIVAFLDDSIEDMIADLPDWNFQTYKVSSSIFRVTATDSLGRNVERTGTGLDELHKQVAEDAMSIERQCKQNESN